MTFSQTAVLTGLCKNNVEYVYIDMFPANSFCKILFLAKIIQKKSLAKINRFIAFDLIWCCDAYEIAIMNVVVLYFDVGALLTILKNFLGFDEQKL